MVVFGLFGMNRIPSNTAIPSGPPTLMNTEIDVLEELMSLNTNIVYTADKNENNGLDTSSFNLEEIINRISVKNDNKNIDIDINYKDALLNSLYSQVEHLRQESLGKDNIIKHLINISVVRNNVHNDSNELGLNSAIITEVNHDVNNYMQESKEYINDSCHNVLEIGESIDIVNDNYTSNLNTDSDNNSETFDTDFNSTSITSSSEIPQSLQTRHEQYDDQLVESRKANIIDRGIKHSFINTFENKNDACYNDVPRVPVPSMLSKNNDNLNVKKWPRNTLLVASDSIYNSIDEKRLSNRTNVKVRAFSGATVEDMYYYLYPLLSKEPDRILLHVGTNNCMSNDADEILLKILQLKAWIEDCLPNCTVILSEPIIRVDSPKLSMIIKELIGKLNELDIPFMKNCNIEREQLGRKGVHLNNWGNARLAMNIMSLIRDH